MLAVILPFVFATRLNANELEETRASNSMMNAALRCRERANERIARRQWRDGPATPAAPHRTAPHLCSRRCLSNPNPIAFLRVEEVEVRVKLCEREKMCATGGTGPNSKRNHMDRPGLEDSRGCARHGARGPQSSSIHLLRPAFQYI